MGVDLGDIVPRRKISMDDLAGKVLAVDAYNTLYQFLAIIRQPDGTPLMDKRGRITSHLSGLLYRTSNLVEKGIGLVYVFDGEPPALKEMEVRRRRRIKEEAAVKYEAALKAGLLEEARRYAQMTSQLKDEMVDDAKRLLTALGVPWVQAPSEGEAQAAYMTMKGDAWATASQDHDALLFGAPRIVRNLTLTGRRKLPRKSVYVEVEPEIIELTDVLRQFRLTREQLVDVGILIGTDFNPDGVKGIGPKTAIKLIREHGSIESAMEVLGEAGLPEDAGSIRDIFLKPKITENYELNWRKPDSDVVVRFLCGERDFSEDRVRKAVEKMERALRVFKGGSRLESFFS